MTDYYVIKDILEMSELLEDYTDTQSLTFIVPDERNDENRQIVLDFNLDGELIQGYIAE